MTKELYTPKERELLNYVMRHQFNAITADDVFEIKDGCLTLEDKIIPIKDVKAIINGAKTIKSMFTFKQVMKEVEYKAKKQMYDGKVDADMVFGKATLWATTIIKDTLDWLINLETKNLNNK